MMRVRKSMLFSMVLLFFLTINVFVVKADTNDEAIQSFNMVLASYYNDFAEFTGGGFVGGPGFTVFDINNDGVIELIFTGFQHKEKEYSSMVYFYDKKTKKTTHQFLGERITKIGKGAFCSSYSNSGIKTETIYSCEGNKISQIAGATVSEGLYYADDKEISKNEYNAIKKEYGLKKCMFYDPDDGTIRGVDDFCGTPWGLKKYFLEEFVSYNNGMITLKVSEFPDDKVKTKTFKIKKKVETLYQYEYYPSKGNALSKKEFVKIMKKTKNGRTPYKNKDYEWLACYDIHVDGDTIVCLTEIGV